MGGMVMSVDVVGSGRGGMSARRRAGQKRRRRCSVLEAGIKQLDRRCLLQSDLVHTRLGPARRLGGGEGGQAGQGARSPSCGPHMIMAMRAWRRCAGVWNTAWMLRSMLVRLRDEGRGQQSAAAHPCQHPRLVISKHHQQQQTEGTGTHAWLCMRLPFMLGLGPRRLGSRTISEGRTLMLPRLLPNTPPRPHSLPDLRGGEMAARLSREKWTEGEVRARQGRGGMPSWHSPVRAGSRVGGPAAAKAAAAPLCRRACGGPRTLLRMLRLLLLIRVHGRGGGGRLVGIVLWLTIGPPPGQARTAQVAALGSEGATVGRAGCAVVPGPEVGEVVVGPQRFFRRKEGVLPGADRNNGPLPCSTIWPGMDRLHSPGARPHEDPSVSREEVFFN